MTLKHLLHRKVIVLTLLSALYSGNEIFVSPASAQEAGYVFTEPRIIGDGQDGRLWRQEKISYPQGKELRGVEAKIRLRHGSRSAYMNARFEGKGTLEDGKRVKLRRGQTVHAAWNIRPEESLDAKKNRRSLVFNIYGGEAIIEEVRLVTSESEATREPSLRPEQESNSSNDFLRGSSASSSQDFSDNQLDLERCEKLGNRRGSFRRPKFELGRIRGSSSLFSGKYRLSGVITGACIEDAAYFEQGRRVKEFEIPFSSRFQRHSIDATVRGGRRGEIRILCYDGSQEVIEVDRMIRSSRRSGSQTQNQNDALIEGVGEILN